LSDTAKIDPFKEAALRSRSLHGHMYVLPVALWILRSESKLVSPADAMVGLEGRADRHRVIEALVRLCAIGALEELPRADHKNAAREFQRVEDPYWFLVEGCAAELAASQRVSS
jgi:hypothetical protein